MALMTALIWSFSYIHIIWLSEHLPPAELVAVRFDFFLLAVLGLWMWRRPNLWHLTGRQWMLVLGVGMVGGPAYHLSLAWGAAENRIEASLIGVIIATIPIHVGWIAWIALGERLTIRRILGLLLGLGGMLLVIYGQYGEISFWQGGGIAALAGPIAVTVAAVLGALNTVLARAARHVIQPIDLMAVSGLVGVVVCLSYQPFVGMAEVSVMPWTAWWAAFYLGVPAIAIAYLTWYAAVSGLPSVIVAMYLFLTSVLSALWAWLWQDNTIGGWFVCGALLVLAGLVIPAWPGVRRGPGGGAPVRAAQGAGGAATDAEVAECAR